MIAWLASFLGSSAFKAIAAELRQARLDRLNAENDEQRRKAEIRIKEIEAEMAERSRKLADPLLKLPLFVAELSVAVYIAAIMVDSTFPMDWLTPLELPGWFIPHFHVVVVSIFGIATVERFLKR